MFLLPRGKELRRTKRWNHRTHFFPDVWLRPNETGAARTEQPFVCAGGKGVASQRRDLWIFHANSMHTVHDQKHTIGLIAAAVYFRQCFSDPRDRQPHATAGMHPGDAECTRVWSNRFADANGYFIRGNCVVRIEKR